MGRQGLESADSSTAHVLSNQITATTIGSTYFGQYAIWKFYLVFPRRFFEGDGKIAMEHANQLKVPIIVINNRHLQIIEGFCICTRKEANCSVIDWLFSVT